MPKDKLEASLAYLNGTIGHVAHGVDTAMTLTGLTRSTSMHAALAVVGAWCCRISFADDEADDGGSWS